jgi:hypothetical protein
MRKLCFVLTLALGGAFIVTPGEAGARTRQPHVGKHHHAKQKTSYRYGHLAETRSHRHRHVANRGGGRSVSLAGVTPVLAAKARQIVASCGSTIVSAVSSRPNRSNHPIGRAVDLVGNPGCIYAHLKGWPGGYSTDYAAARHVHISYNPGGQEWGLRFAHNGHRKTRVARYASRNMTRHYAQTDVTRDARSTGTRYVMHPAAYSPATHNVH